MLGDKIEQQHEDWYHGDGDALRDPQSVETGSHAKRSNSAGKLSEIGNKITRLED